MNDRKLLSEKEFGELMAKEIMKNNTIIEVEDAILTINQDPNVAIPEDIKNALQGSFYIMFENCEIHIKNVIDIGNTRFTILFDSCDVYRESPFPFCGRYCWCRIHFDSFDLDYDYFCDPCTFDKPFPTYCPKDGAFIGYKVVRELLEPNAHHTHRCRILKFLVPSDAKRSSAYTKACRCDKIIPLEVYDLKGNLINNKANNYESCYVPLYCYAPRYRIFETAYSDAWDFDRFNECSHGIHFFMSYDEAVKYCVDYQKTHGETDV